MSEVNKIIESVAKNIFKNDEMSIMALRKMLDELRQAQLDQSDLRRYGGAFTNPLVYNQQQVNQLDAATQLAQQQAMRNQQLYIQFRNTASGRNGNE